MIKPILSQIDKMNRLEIPNLKNKKPSLKLGLSHIFEKSLFYRINQFVHEDPLFSYDLVVVSKSEIIQKLISYEIDVAVVVLTQDEVILLNKQGFTVNSYYDITFDAYACKSSSSKKELSHTIKELKLILQTCQEAIFHREDAIYFSSYVTIFNAIKQGIGYGFLPTVLLTKEEKEGLININHEVDYSLPKVNSYYVYACGAPKNKIIHHLFNYKACDNR